VCVWSVLSPSPSCDHKKCSFLRHWKPCDARVHPDPQGRLRMLQDPVAVLGVGPLGGWGRGRGRGKGKQRSIYRMPTNVSSFRWIIPCVLPALLQCIPIILSPAFYPTGCWFVVGHDLTGALHFPYLIAPVVSCHPTSISLSSNKMQNEDILIPANTDSCSFIAYSAGTLLCSQCAVSRHE